MFEYQGDRRVEPEVIRRMTATLAHRGPDDEGFLVLPFVGLGMRRLSIIDVQGGHQPISNEDHSVHVILNGEIYNHHELRRSLLQRGHTFRTHSDTEVIVHLYEEYGRSCLEFLDGMFAFAIWDARPLNGGGSLLVGRDRVGKKPLYFMDSGRALVFGSEIKALLAEGRVDRVVDAQAVHDYLSLGMIPGPQSIYRHVKKLMPGHTLEVRRDGTVNTQRYWGWPTDDNPPVDAGEAVTQVRQLLMQAVEKRLEAEVPIGAFLSGGLDSSLVCAMASRLSGKPLDTFSVGFEGPESHNELPYARIAARHIGSRHHEFVMRPSIIELLPEILEATDEPFAISSAIPLLMISKAARELVTIALTGDGGDEVLGGYEHYRYERWASIVRRMPRQLACAASNVAGRMPGKPTSGIGRAKKRVRQFFGNVHGSVASRRLGWTGWFTEEDKWELYSPAWRRRALRAGVIPTSAHLLLLAGRAESDPGYSARYLDAVVWLPDEMLAKVDRMTMRASVEARCPFLDRALIEYCAALPIQTKIPGGRRHHLKWILRKVASEFLPDELLVRRKHGFNVPLDAWFRGESGREIEKVILGNGSGENQVFDAVEMTNILNVHRSGAANFGNRLFALATLQLWTQREPSGQIC